MKIYSWNVLFSNKRAKEALEYIRTLEYDVLCLQEVTEETLAELKKLPVSIVYCCDVRKKLKTGTVSTYNVTLTPHAIEKHTCLPFRDYWNVFPFHTKLLINVIRPFNWSKENGRHGLATDIRIGDQLVQVFNLHLILAKPTWRIREFEEAMLTRNHTLPTVVCGDFNTIESPVACALNWFFGASVMDALLFRRERTQIEERFASHALANVFRGHHTHPFSRSQLDHILVSKELTIAHFKVHQDRFGSDHHPISVDISPTSPSART